MMLPMTMAIQPEVRFHMVDSVQENREHNRLFLTIGAKASLTLVKGGKWMRSLMLEGGPHMIRRNGAVWGHYLPHFSPAVLEVWMRGLHHCSTRLAIIQGPIARKVLNHLVPAKCDEKVRIGAISSSRVVIIYITVPDALRRIFTQRVLIF